MAKKALIAAMISVGGLAILAAAGYAFVMRQFKDVAPGETAFADVRLAVVKADGANMYLMRGPDGYVAFDSGDSKEAVAAGLKLLGIDPLDVKALFLTHSDYDHLAGAALFPNAALYLPKAEVPYVDGTRKRTIFRFFGSRNSLPFTRYQAIGPDQAIDACGLRIQAVPVPGHTAGSTAFLVDGVLFTGDSLLLKDGKAIRPIAALTEDMETAKRSIEKLATMPGIASLCTGHTGYQADAASALVEWRGKVEKN
jgi:glyoxylase-like metal-dependent hydrolase (beta-lactamase superfamily II)